MKTRLIITAALIAATAGNLLAQGLAVNSDGSDPNANAMLDVVSPSTGAGKGMLVPRITAAQRTTASAALAGGLLDDSGDLRGGAAQGLLVYQTDGTDGFYYNASSTATPSWSYIGGGTMSAQDANAVAITGGSINGTAIGGLVPAAAYFTETVHLDQNGCYYLGGDKALHRGKGALAGNLVVGSGGGNLSNTAGVEGMYNTFVGLASGAVCTTGSSNTAVGYMAASDTSTGGSNTAVGSYALFYNTSGGENTAVGSGVMSSNNTGSYNTAIGSAALKSNKGGNTNTAIGYQALSANTSGYSNTAIGYQALTANTTNANNVAVGYAAMAANTSGFANVAVGMEALKSNTTNSYNTAVGMSALEFNDALSNTAVGYEAGKSNTSGVGNLFIGRQAGDANTSGSGNTFVGANADASAGGFSNAMAIGANAVVDASNKVVIGDGSVTVIGGSVAWSTLSDARFKANVRDNELGLDFIERLRPVKFNYKEHDETVVHDGFIAQEVEQACEELGVEFGGLNRPENIETGRYMLSYSEFVVPLVNAVKQQQRQMETQQGQIETLEAEIKALKEGE